MDSTLLLRLRLVALAHSLSSSRSSAGNLNEVGTRNVDVLKNNEK